MERLENLSVRSDVRAAHRESPSTHEHKERPVVVSDDPSFEEVRGVVWLGGGRKYEGRHGCGGLAIVVEGLGDEFDPLIDPHHREHRGDRPCGNGDGWP